VLRTVPIPDLRRVDDYREAAGDEAVERLLEAAHPLKGARLIHISSTSFGGGVAELLPTQVALLQDLGIDTEWQLLEASEEFFTVTKLVHNALQGMPVPWTDAFEATYLERVRSNAERFEPEADFVFVHDPQPVALLTFVEEAGRREGRWAWRCHIDLSQPMEQVWSFFAVHVARYDAAVFTLQDFVKPGVAPRVSIIPPSIDPLSPKNAYLDPDAVREILVAYGIDPERPVVTQVSRFDPWKDPLGVIDAVRVAKAEVSEAHLILVGSMAHDDPEAWHFLELAQEHSGDDPDIHILTNLQDVGPDDRIVSSNGRLAYFFPGRVEFGSTDTHLGAAYESAWLACGDPSGRRFADPTSASVLPRSSVLIPSLFPASPLHRNDHEAFCVLINDCPGFTASGSLESC
jgi:trehalose synthase